MGSKSINTPHLYPSTCVCTGWYCTPIWSRSRHTGLLDVSLNCTLNVITGCLQSTPVEQLPLLAGIPPAELPRRAPSLVLAHHAMTIDHHLHYTITREETQPRLKSWHRIATSGKELLSTTIPNETKAHWIARMWSAEWQRSTSRPHEYITSPSRSSPGSDLPRQAWPWVKLNRLRTGVGRFNADMWRWGLSKSPACNCGADQQTANHIITECPPYRPPSGLQGLIAVDADAATREWLLSKFPEI